MTINPSRFTKPMDLPMGQKQHIFSQTRILRGHPNHFGTAQPSFCFGSISHLGYLAHRGPSRPITAMTTPCTATPAVCVNSNQWGVDKTCVPPYFSWDTIKNLWPFMTISLAFSRVEPPELTLGVHGQSILGDRQHCKMTPCNRIQNDPILNQQFGKVHMLLSSSDSKKHNES